VFTRDLIKISLINIAFIAILHLINGLSDLYVGMENKMYLCTQILSQFTIQILETYLLKKSIWQINYINLRCRICKKCQIVMKCRNIIIFIMCEMHTSIKTILFDLSSFMNIPYLGTCNCILYSLSIVQ
jgi:hypothetical protein